MIVTGKSELHRNQSKEQYALLTNYDLNTSYSEVFHTFSEVFHTLFANIRFNWETNTQETRLCKDDRAQDTIPGIDPM